MLKMYGIPNCDTVKKAMKFLNDNSVEFEFINFKKNPPNQKMLKNWKDQIGEVPVNKRGPTFRKIKEEYELASPTKKLELLCQNTSAIKRPLIEKSGQISSVGFSIEEFQQYL